MPWKEIKPMELRKEMIGNWAQGNYKVAELSRIYKVSRKTVYKWIKRYHEAGEEELRERSRVPPTINPVAPVMRW